MQTSSSSARWRSLSGRAPFSSPPGCAHHSSLAFAPEGGETSASARATVEQYSGAIHSARRTRSARHVALEYAARRGQSLVGQLGAVGEADHHADHVAVAEGDDEHRADDHPVGAQVVERPAQRAGRRQGLDLRHRRHRSRMPHALVASVRVPSEVRSTIRIVEGRPTEIAIASGRVAQIVEAAERAAEQLRATAEQRARDRIAEADRAADLRVQAAEGEAIELIGGAHEQVAGVHAEADAVRRAAEDEALQLRSQAALDADQMRSEAEEKALETHARAQTDAREVIAEAHAAARDVLRDGEQLSGNLRELSDSLRTNAERLLRDVRLAHAELTSRLDRAIPEAAAPRPRDTRPAADLDVPEFIPPA